MPHAFCLFTVIASIRSIRLCAADYQGRCTPRLFLKHLACPENRQASTPITSFRRIGRCRGSHCRPRSSARQRSDQRTASTTGKSTDRRATTGANQSPTSGTGAGIIRTAAPRQNGHGHQSDSGQQTHTPSTAPWFFN